VELFFWDEAHFASPQAYKDRAQELLADAYLAFRRHDTKALGRLLDVAMESSSRAVVDPYATTYENTIGLCSLLSAICYAAEGKHEDVYQIVTLVLLMQDFSDARRRANGAPVLPASELRYTALNVLGDVKWQGDERDRDRVMTPEEMAVEWPRLYELAMYYMYEWHREDTQRIADVKHALGWAGLQVIKTATRFLDGLTVCDLITKFNKWYGPQLAMGRGDFKNRAPLNVNSPWYFDYELTKLHLAGQLVQQDLDYLYEQRERLLNQEDSRCSVYKASAAREYVVLRSGCTLEVLNGAAAS
jgi:hypothetical protein